MAKEFATTVHDVEDGDGARHSFKPGDDVPAWAVKALHEGGWKDDREDLWVDKADSSKK